MARGDSGPKQKKPGLPAREWLWRLGLAGVGGVGVFLAFPRFDLAPLAWFTLVPMVFSVRGTSGRQHFFIGWWAGTVTNLGGFFWIGGMLQDFGHMSVWLAAPLTLLLATYQGLVFALWLWLLHFLQRRSRLGLWLLAPVSYVSSEALVPFIFPWFYANSQYWAIPFIQICELGGVTLLSFLLVMANGFFADAWQRWREHGGGVWRRLAFGLAVPALVFAYGLVRMAMVDARIEKAAHLTIGLVEADVGIWEKEDPLKIKDNLVRHQRMTVELVQRGAELIVWPETSYQAPYVYARRAGHDTVERFPYFPHDVAFIPQSDAPPPEHASEDDQAGVPMADRLAPQRGFKVPLLFGALTWRPNPENRFVRHPKVDLLNTAILLDRDGKVLGTYDKVYLLMFGEYIPLGETFPVFYDWLPEAGDLTPGKSVEVLPFGDFRIGVMVCYEDIIPAFSRQISGKDPNILINVTNDAWFGKTSEPYLHLALAVFRAVENRLVLIRSTNTGVSAFIDPLGRILAETKITDPETLLQRVPMMEGGTLYQLLADWPAYLCLLAIPGIWLIARRRRATEK